MKKLLLLALLCASACFAQGTLVGTIGVGLPMFASGQTAVTGTAAVLASSAPVHTVCVKALSTNTISIYLGATGVTTSTGYELKASEAVCINVLNINQIFVVASTTGATAAWFSLN